MKKFLLITLSLIAVVFLNAQNKQAPKSPPAVTKAELGSGATITITYSQPSVKGRTIGKDLEPLPGQIWRTGANKATVVEFSQDVTVEGKTLAAGKYALFTLVEGKQWTIIFNKSWDVWGAFKYKEAEDVLRVSVTSEKAPAFAEQLNITANKDGVVTILWGDNKVSFTVK